MYSIFKIFLRVVVALGLWLVWSEFARGFGEYFSPCDVLPQDPFELNCHTFVGFSWGFGFALIWLLITPKHPWLYFLGILFVVLIAIADQLRGGFEVLESAAGWQLVLVHGYPTILGGLSAAGVYIAGYSVATKRPSNDRLNDG